MAGDGLMGIGFEQAYQFVLSDSLWIKRLTQIINNFKTISEQVSIVVQGHSLTLRCIDTRQSVVCDVKFEAQFFQEMAMYIEGEMVVTVNSKAVATALKHLRVPQQLELTADTGATFFAFGCRDRLGMDHWWHICAENCLQDPVAVMDRIDPGDDTWVARASLGNVKVLEEISSFSDIEQAVVTATDDFITFTQEGELAPRLKIRRGGEALAIEAREGVSTRMSVDDLHKGLRLMKALEGRFDIEFYRAGAVIFRTQFERDISGVVVLAGTELETVNQARGADIETPVRRRPAARAAPSVGSMAPVAPPEVPRMPSPPPTRGDERQIRRAVVKPSQSWGAPAPPPEAPPPARPRVVVPPSEPRQDSLLRGRKGLEDRVSQLRQAGMLSDSPAFPWKRRAGVEGVVAASQSDGEDEEV